MPYAQGAILTDVAGNPLEMTSNRHAFVDVVLTVPTSGVTAGEVLADTQVISNLFRANDLGGKIESIMVIDADDTKDAFDLVFLSDNVPLGTEGAAPSISDANALLIAAAGVQVLAANWTDLGGVSIQTIGGIDKVVKPKAGTRDLYVAATMVTATAQFAGGSIKLRIGMTLD